MTERIKGSEMSEQSEMLRELRQDIRGLHNKIDDHNNQNHAAHACLQKQLATISERSGINKAQIVTLVTFLTLFVAGAVNWGFHTIG